MLDMPSNLLHRLKSHRQDHVLEGWVKLTAKERKEFANQLTRIDFDELETLFSHRMEPEYVLPSRDRIQPIPVAAPDATPTERTAGEEAFRRGEIAALVVAGGQGSRLGFDKPKGMFPIGPVSGVSLFQIHAEKLLGLSRRYRKPIPFLVMTSPATDADTRAYFVEQRFFGLDAADVIFFQQGTMPAVCASTGRLLLEKPGQLFLSPNGHGGTLTALAESGVLKELRSRGIKHIYYFQVDNPLVKLCDPGFIGRHVGSKSEASSKVVFKEKPEEKVGVLAVLDGKCGIIEYTFLPKEMAGEREMDGSLRYRAGSPAIHLFSVEFLERVTSAEGLPYHVAHKAVTHYDPISQVVVTPAGNPNALKFERFIFDALPLAERWLAVETSRDEEFSPVKNATGSDSPDTSRASQIALHTRWLARAGVSTNGHPLEVSPLFALDEDELKAKIPKGFTIAGPTYLR
ncbi:MAG TPA: UDPGP type 1 family protein [Gemmata sp.]|jgi:UDP-N-acetylglucosamine/UDP-N-acetylgalactosamine diphosphorylase|nr:UDPGP type 1 family protein [Gemmata sp.]